MKKLLFLVIALLLVSPALVSANMLVNPGFETGDVSGWTEDWNIANQYASTSNPHNGTYALRNANDGGMYQDVDATAGWQYQLTGYEYIGIKGGTSAWGSFVGLQFLDASDNVIGDTEIDTTAFTPLSYQLADTGLVTAPTGTITARVRFGTWANTPYDPLNPTDFDDFDLTAVPEPSSLMLLLTGITGIFGLGLKRKK